MSTNTEDVCVSPETGNDWCNIYLGERKKKGDARNVQIIEPLPNS